ncbi:MAG: electron transfer flavoprotein subunit beta/FixA family protein [Hespellia sp.]|nr:electron transfer flavoprotein subunit beta/FixA family protein [Hespellia sp.]
MNILVCIKQVPDTTEIKIDPVKKTLIREGVPSIVNTYDTYALENAARIKDQDASTQIVVLSMGPEQAKTALKECLAIAADKAYLVTDRAFGGSDTLATSYILSEAIKKVEELEGYKFDAIFCGKQAIDGDTAQVGPEIAEHLDLPQVTYALEVENSEEGFKVTQQGPENKQIIAVSTPCVITFTQPDFEVRYPTIRRKMAANKAQIPNITAADLEGSIDLTRCGLKGSPTHVKSTFVPVHDSNIQFIEEETLEEAGAKLANILSDEHII